jgi:NAD(P)-dependent dehydrogenase (short-subunit alcohol dehydrogenase family)
MSTVLITGAGRGIGLALVSEFRAHGHDVIATVRDAKKGDALKALGADVHSLEVTDPASVAGFVKALGGKPIDYLINNAGVGERAAIGGLDYDLFAKVLEINTIAPMRMLEALTPNVTASEKKTAVAISSLMGSIDDVGNGYALIYRTSKAALNMAMRSAAFTLAEKGISLMVLHPGWVQTDMGGSQAPVTPAESAAGLYKVITGSGASNTLRFMDFTGKALKW